jgi:hypothetical protein
MQTKSLHEIKNVWELHKFASNHEADQSPLKIKVILENGEERWNDQVFADIDSDGYLRLTIQGMR